MTRLYTLLPLLLLFFSCGKDAAEKIPFKKTDTGLKGNLNVICALNRTTFITAGKHHDEGAVAISHDAGSQWSILPGRTEGSITALLVMDSVTWYAGTSVPHAYKTTNGGITWEKLWVNTSYPPNYRKPVRRIIKTDHATVFFVLGGDFEAGGIWKTYDGGITWKAHTFNFELRDLAFENSLSGYACGFGNMIRTSDGGENWTFSPCSNGYFMKLNFDENKKWWCVSFNGGVFFSTDPSEGWNEKMSAAKVFASRKNFNGFLWDGDKAVLFGENGLLMTGNASGNLWNEASCCNESSIRDLSVSGNHYIACGRNGEVYLMHRN